MKVLNELPIYLLASARMSVAIWDRMENGPTARVPGEYKGISGRPRDDSDRKVKVTLIGVH